MVCIMQHKPQHTKFFGIYQNINNSITLLNLYQVLITYKSNADIAIFNISIFLLLFYAVQIFAWHTLK